MKKGMRILGAGLICLLVVGIVLPSVTMASKSFSVSVGDKLVFNKYYSEDIYIEVTNTGSKDLYIQGVRVCLIDAATGEKVETSSTLSPPLPSSYLRSGETAHARILTQWTEPGSYYVKVTIGDIAGQSPVFQIVDRA